jgi:hypothetical protein
MAAGFTVAMLQAGQRFEVGSPDKVSYWKKPLWPRRNLVQFQNPAAVVVVVAQAVVFLELCRWPSEGGSSSPDI